MKVNSVGWFEIYVEDMSRAKKFYESVLNKELDSMITPESAGELEMCGFPGSMQNYGSNGALVKMPGAPSGKNSIVIYFACADCAVEEARVKESGGSIHKSKFSIGEYSFISLVNDTEGNLIGLHSMN
ncbi:MAG: VOC family protein [Bdellovibrionales bacterium]|nr:VOC family protein [Bdellovibrionales bacterium]